MTANEIISILTTVNDLNEIGEYELTIVPEDNATFIEGIGYTAIEFGSWKGSYDLCAVRIVEGSTTVLKFVEFLNNISTGNTFYDYKGGEFFINGDNEIFFVESMSSAGNSEGVSEIFVDYQKKSVLIKIIPDMY